MRTYLVVGLVWVGAVGCSRPHEGALDSVPAVEGIVVDSSGVAIPRVSIIREGYRNSAGLEPWFDTDVDGHFRVDGMPTGDVVLRVIPGEPDIRTGELIRTHTGVRDLRIVLEPGPQLLIRIADYVSPPRAPRHARVVWTEPDGRVATRYAPIRADGWTRFIRLPRDANLEVWALAAPGHPVKSGGLRAGDREIRVEPVTGEEIRGTVGVSSGDSLGNVSLSATVVGHPGFQVGLATIERNGAFVISDLPSGPYRVSARFASGHISLPVVHDVRTGVTDADFDMRR